MTILQATIDTPLGDLTLTLSVDGFVPDAPSGGAWPLVPGPGEVPVTEGPMWGGKADSYEPRIIPSRCDVSFYDPDGDLYALFLALTTGAQPETAFRLRLEGAGPVDASGIGTLTVGPTAGMPFLWLGKAARFDVQRVANRVEDPDLVVTFTDGLAALKEREAEPVGGRSVANVLSECAALALPGTNLGALTPLSPDGALSDPYGAQYLTDLVFALDAEKKRGRVESASGALLSALGALGAVCYYDAFAGRFAVVAELWQGRATDGTERALVWDASAGAWSAETVSARTVAIEEIDYSAKGGRLTTARAAGSVEVSGVTNFNAASDPYMLSHYEDTANPGTYLLSYYEMEVLGDAQAITPAMVSGDYWGAGVPVGGARLLSVGGASDGVGQRGYPVVTDDDAFLHVRFEAKKAPSAGPGTLTVDVEVRLDDLSENVLYLQPDRTWSASLSLVSVAGGTLTAAQPVPSAGVLAVTLRRGSEDVDVTGLVVDYVDADGIPITDYVYRAADGQGDDVEVTAPSALLAPYDDGQENDPVTTELRTPPSWTSRLAGGSYAGLYSARAAERLATQAPGLEALTDSVFGALVPGARYVLPAEYGGGTFVPVVSRLKLREKGETAVSLRQIPDVLL